MKAVKVPSPWLESQALSVVALFQGGMITLGEPSLCARGGGKANWRKK